MNSVSTNQKLMLSALVGFLVGAGAVFVWDATDVDAPTNVAIEEGDGAMTEEEGAMEEGGTSTAAPASLQQAGAAAAAAPVASNGDRVSVTDQPAGGVVAVSSVNLSAAGWVAVHEDADGELGNVLGAAWFPAGNHSNVVVELLRTAVPGWTYHVVLYRDDGDKAFEYRVDPAIMTGGAPVQSTFIAGALN